METLNRVPERRTVGLREYIRSHLDHVIGAHAQEEPIKRGVVQPAQRQPVVDDWLTVGLGIRNDLRGVEDFIVT